MQKSNNNSSNKGIMVFVIALVVLIVCLLLYIICDKFVFKNDNKENEIVDNNNGNNVLLKENEALLIGESTYLKFLLLTHDNSTYLINNKLIDLVKWIDIDSTDIIKDKDNEYMRVNNFQVTFRKLFVSNIFFDDVFNKKYSIDLKDKNGKYYINRGGNCDASYQNDITLKINKITENKITYTVSSIIEHEEVKKEYEDDFVLQFEDGAWKIAKVTLIESCNDLEAHIIGDNNN